MRFLILVFAFTIGMVHAAPKKNPAIVFPKGFPKNFKEKICTKKKGGKKFEAMKKKMGCK